MIHSLFACLQLTPPLTLRAIRQGVELISLALNTLSTFNFNNMNLLPFVRDCVLAYLDHDNPPIRQQAAETCCALILPNEKVRGICELRTSRLPTRLAFKSCL